jgi:hypothetical protein
MNLFYIERGFHSRTEIGEREIDESTVHIMGAVGNKALSGCLPLPPPSLAWWEAWAGLSPPSLPLLSPYSPLHTLTHWDSFQLPCHILSMIADIGQQQWSCTIFRLSDGTLRSRVRIFVIWQELVKFQAAAWLLVAAWILAISWHGGPVQAAGTSSWYSTGKGRPKKQGSLNRLLTWGLHARFIISTRIWTRALQPDQEEVSSWRFCRA